MPTINRTRPTTARMPLTKMPMIHPRFSWAAVVNEGATITLAPDVCTVTV
jgi:hypothetical protein